jgi:hypothetical protein
MPQNQRHDGFRGWHGGTVVIHHFVPPEPLTPLTIRIPAATVPFRFPSSNTSINPHQAAHYLVDPEPHHPLHAPGWPAEPARHPLERPGFVLPA